jgi:hypothetical protein
MKTHFILILTLIISIAFVDVARADGYVDNLQKTQQTLLKQLDSIGINDKDTQEFIESKTSYIDKNSFNLYEQEVIDGKLSFALHMSSSVSYTSTSPVIHQDRKQLVYTPDFDNNVSVTGSRSSVILGYHFKFN